MNDGYLSPDGKFIWTGSEWRPAPPSSNPEINSFDDGKGSQDESKETFDFPNKAQITNSYPPKPQHPPEWYPPKPQHPPEWYPPKPQYSPEPNPSQSGKVKLRDKSKIIRILKAIISTALAGVAVKASSRTERICRDKSISAPVTAELRIPECNNVHAPDTDLAIICFIIIIILEFGPLILKQFRKR